MASTDFNHALFQDPCFFNMSLEMLPLVREKTHARFIAAGALVYAYALAQEEACADNPRALISREKWTKRGLPDEIIECGLATIEGDFIYVRGAEDMLSWKSKRGLAGRAGGKSTASKRKQNQANASKPNPLTLSPSLAKENTEEGTAPVFEIVKTEIPKSVMKGWLEKYTAQSVEYCLQRGFNYYLAQDARDRSLVSLLVAWVDREDRFLVELPRAASSDNRYTPPPPIEVEPCTAEQLERANAFAERIGLKWGLR